MSKNNRVWRYDDGALPNTLALCYMVIAQISGIILLAVHSPWLFIPAVLLIAHSLVIGGYMIHELAHNIVFKDKRINSFIGECVSWFCGSAYAPFNNIQHMHMRHHGDHADVAMFDHQHFLKQCSPILKRIVYVLEWCHIPAVELIMHYQIVVRPFIREDFKDQRVRVVLMALSRLIFFTMLLFISPAALIAYALAYMIFLKSLFLADAFAHTYPAYIIKNYTDPVPREGRNGDYDKENTYSNLISERWPILNLLNLNFGYHTAHHDRPATPWYRLPEQHTNTYATNAPQVLPYRELWHTFHQNRLACIINDDFGGVGTGKNRADNFLGVHGVSFLTIV